MNIKNFLLSLCVMIFLSCESAPKEAIEDSTFISKVALKIKYDRGTSQIRFKRNDRLNIDWGEELPDHPDDPLDQLPIGHMTSI